MRFSFKVWVTEQRELPLDLSITIYHFYCASSPFWWALSSDLLKLDLQTSFFLFPPWKKLIQNVCMRQKSYSTPSSSLIAGPLIFAGMWNPSRQQEQPAPTCAVLPDLSAPAWPWLRPSKSALRFGAAHLRGNSTHQCALPFAGVNSQLQKPLSLEHSLCAFSF